MGEVFLMLTKASGTPHPFFGYQLLEIAAFQSSLLVKALIFQQMAYFFYKHTKHPCPDWVLMQKLKVRFSSGLTPFERTEYSSPICIDAFRFAQNINFIDRRYITAD